jgi:hypothetical protein
MAFLWQCLQQVRDTAPARSADERVQAPHPAHSSPERSGATHPTQPWHARRQDGPWQAQTGEKVAA